MTQWQQAASAPPPPEWTPGNELERDLVAAVESGEKREFFQLVIGARLYLPAFLDSHRGESDPRPPQRFVTMSLFGHEYLAVFTSVAGLARTLGDGVEAYTVTSYPELARKWPSPEWRLAINPGSPIDAYLTISALADAAAGELVIPTAEEVMAEGRVEAMADAASSGDGETFLSTLLDSDVFMPTRHPAEVTDVTEPDFPWYAAPYPVDTPAPGGPTELPTVTVYPQPGPVPPDVPGVLVPVTALLVAWPDPSWQLGVAMDGRIVTLPGSYLSSLGLTIFDEEETD